MLTLESHDNLLNSSYNKYLKLYNEQYRGKKFQHREDDPKTFVLMVNNNCSYLKSFDTYSELTKFVDEMIDNSLKSC